jgi:hypothetical protein
MTEAADQTIYERASKDALSGYKAVQSRIPSCILAPPLFRAVDAPER